MLIFLFWFHCRSIKFSLFSRKRAKPRERPQKGLKPVWNHSETPSGSPSQNLCFFGYSIITLFRFLVAGMMCWFFCFGFIAGALSSASFLGKEQSPVSAPKRVWNRSETTLKHPLLTIYNAFSLSSPSSSLCLSLSLSPSVCLHLCLVLSSFPDRCMSFRTAMSTIRVRFGCLLFRTAACLSGPQCLQLECVLGACFSGPLHVFPDRNVYS